MKSASYAKHKENKLMELTTIKSLQANSENMVAFAEVLSKWNGDSVFVSDSIYLNQFLDYLCQCMGTNLYRRTATVCLTITLGKGLGTWPYQSLFCPII